MRAATALRKLEKTAFWVKESWDGTFKVCLGQRVGLDVLLPRKHAEELAQKLNAAITETRMNIRKELEGPQQSLDITFVLGKGDQP
jgi:hypothetical protein